MFSDEVIKESEELETQVTDELKTSIKNWFEFKFFQNSNNQTNKKAGPFTWSEK